MLEPMCDERVIDGIRASAECDGQDVVERGTSGMWRRVDRQSTCASADVKLSNHFDDFELETWDVGTNSLGAQEACCEATVLAPNIMRDQVQENANQPLERHLPNVIVRRSSDSTTDEDDL